MAVNKSSRREFLGVAGTSLAGLAIASVALTLPKASASSKAAARQNSSIETWLLSTGQDDLDPAIFTVASQQLQEIQR